MRYRFKRRIILFVIFLVLAILSFHLGNKINLTLDSGDYYFEIQEWPMNRMVFNNFLIDYDFKHKIGSISFKAKESYIGPIKYLAVEVPFPLQIKDHYIKGDWRWKPERDYKYEITRNETTQRNFIIFEDFNPAINESVNFNITIEGNEDFIPNGLFRLSSYGARTYAAGRKTFNLALGDFECRSYCFAAPISVSTEIKNNVIEIRYPPDYYQDLGAVENTKQLHQAITINTINKKLETRRNLSYSFVVALMVAALVFLGEAYTR